MNLKTLWPLVRPIKITKRFIANHLAVFKISENVLPCQDSNLISTLSVSYSNQLNYMFQGL